MIAVVLRAIAPTLAGLSFAIIAAQSSTLDSSARSEALMLPFWNLLFPRLDHLACKMLALERQSSTIGVSG